MKMRFIAMAVLLLLAVQSVSALSELLEKCKYSGDCRSGYCSEGVCKLPGTLDCAANGTCRYISTITNYTVTGNCSITAQCLEGYCSEGDCLLPKHGAEYAAFTFGVKSGCAGIIEDCLGIWCLFCNVTWIFLAVGALIAAAIGRKRGRFLPIILILVPVAFGLVVLPLLGFLMSLVEIFILIVVKPKGVFRLSELIPSLSKQSKSTK